MSYPDVLTAIETTVAAVPGLNVSRGDQYRPSRRGGVIPTRQQCPMLRITPIRPRGSSERPLTYDGQRQRTSRYLLALWDYATDAELASPAFLSLREQVSHSVRRNWRGFGALPGVFRVNVVEEDPTPRPVSIARGASVVHATLTLEAVEVVS